MAADIYGQLSGARWRSIAFPVTSFETSLRHDLVQHAYPDRDGAQLEATGRAPLSHSFKIPFRSNILPGKGEGWQPGTLYPNVWRLFMAACADRARGTLLHPELGSLTCRVESCRTNWDGKAGRDGVDVDVTFLEDTEAPEDLENVLSSGSPITQLESSALTVDTYINALVLAKVASLQVPAYQYSFSDLVRQVKAVVDVVTVARYQASGPLDRLVYQANGIKASLDSARRADTWPLANALETVKASVHDVRKTLGLTQKPVKLYTVPQDQTFAAIATATGAKLRDLISLNPTYLAAPTVPRGTVVRYYA